MKFIYAISAAFVAAAAAQDLNSINDCGKLCINNMITIANTQFGCANGDAKCYCNNPDFAKGLSACSVEACGAAVQSQVVSYGTTYCQNAGAASGASSASASVTSSAASSASSAASSASGALSSARSSASSAVSSVSQSVNSAASSAASRASSATSSAASSASSAASSAASSGFAMKTAAPVAGAGALGLAMLFI